VLEAERTEGRRKRIATILAWRDQALIDVQTAFAGDDASERTTQ
jgi:hypothetical protein